MVEVSDEDKLSLKRLVKKPNYIPIVVIVDEKDIKIKKMKFLAMKNTEFSVILMNIRKKINLSSEKAIFVFTENRTLAPSNKTIGEIYEQSGNKELDALIFTLKMENTFGNDKFFL